MSQKRMGPAPFASFEDLQDDFQKGFVESPPKSLESSQKLEGIEEVSTPSEMASQTRLQTPSTPRIDISRASSSSHHDDSVGAGGSDSRDSTPERELFGPQCDRLGPAFREDGALDLRSSTEELDFQDPNDPIPPRKPEQPGRKDSQGSELAFLSVSGRTSRLSSIGSQGSRASGASRSPSPHKMLLETSFCGPKGGSEGQPAGQPPLEQALLARQIDPSEAVLAEGISIEMRKKIGGSPNPNNNRTTKNQQPVIPIVKVDNQGETERNSPPPIPPGATIVAESGVEYTYIPLRGPLPTPQTKVKILAKAQTKPQVKKPQSAPTNTPKKPVTKVTPSGTEYIRIKLKPDHLYSEKDETDDEAPIKPDTLTLKNGTMADGPSTIQLPEPSRPNIPANSRTPSPSVSRKSSFTSLFRSRESATSSPESPAPRGKSKSAGTSSVLGSIFKPKKSCIKKQTSPETTPKSVRQSRPPNLEFTFGGGNCSGGNSKPKLLYYETPLEGDSIRIPLHSPGKEPEPLELFSPDVPAPAPKEPDKDKDKDSGKRGENREGKLEMVSPPPSVPNPRHSSTSSDNIVFSTNLGSNNEIFTTKLPKDRVPHAHATENHVSRPNRERTPSLDRDRVPPIPPPRTPSGDRISAHTKSPSLDRFQQIQQTQASRSRSPSLDKFPGTQNSSRRTSMEKVEQKMSQVENFCPENGTKPIKEPVLEMEKSGSFERPPSLLNSDLEKPNSLSHQMTRSESSGSERDTVALPLDKGIASCEGSEHELRTLVDGEEVLEDLPYIPTTLPLERSVCVPIVPIKERTEVRTRAIDRPRSTTPINPTCLDEYGKDLTPKSEGQAGLIEEVKLRISLPQVQTPPGGGRTKKVEGEKVESPPPPLPPRSGNWINFEEVPERRKPPKRIQVLPQTVSAMPSSVRSPPEENVVYSYVNPEECKCECHEAASHTHAPHPPQQQGRHHGKLSASSSS